MEGPWFAAQSLIMNPDEKKPKQDTKEDLDRSDWEGMGQQRFQPEEATPAQVKEENKTKGPTPGSNSLAGQIQK